MTKPYPRSKIALSKRMIFSLMTFFIHVLLSVSLVSAAPNVHSVGSQLLVPGNLTATDDFASLTHLQWADIKSEELDYKNEQQITGEQFVDTVVTAAKVNDTGPNGGMTGKNNLIAIDNADNIASVYSDAAVITTQSVVTEVPLTTSGNPSDHNYFAAPQALNVTTSAASKSLSINFRWSW